MKRARPHTIDYAGNLINIFNVEGFLPQIDVVLGMRGLADDWQQLTIDQNILLDVTKKLVIK